MYENAGREIKNWVKIFVLIATIPSLLLGILFMIALAQVDAIVFGIMIAVIVTAIGYFFARFGGLIIYAYGEIADRILLIDERLANQEKARQNAENDGKPSWQKVPQTPPGKWRCSVCDQTNPAESKWCAKCRSPR